MILPCLIKSMYETMNVTAIGLGGGTKDISVTHPEKLTISACCKLQITGNIIGTVNE